MKSIATTIAIASLTTLLVQASSQAADIVLRQRVTRQGAMVRLGDIADIVADTVSERNGLASTPLLPAPVRGTMQYLNVSQIRDLLTARGVRLDRLRISGATVVELGTLIAPSQTPSQTPSDFRSIAKSVRNPVANSAAQQQTPRELELLARKAIEKFVIDNTTNNTASNTESNMAGSTPTGRWRVDVSLHERDTLKLADLHGKLSARTQTKLRAGRQRFFISDENGGREIALSAKLTKIQSVVVMRQLVERGQLVRASDIEIRDQEGNLSSQSLVDLDRAIGKEAIRTLRPESVVRESDLRAPWQIRKGETVSVVVRTGGIAVGTRAIAKQNGAKGD